MQLTPDASNIQSDIDFYANEKADDLEINDEDDLKQPPKDEDIMLPVGAHCPIDSMVPNSMDTDILLVRLVDDIGF